MMLYFRMLLTTGVSLYTVRIVLNALGAEDYGIYTVAGGIVALCSFLPGTMASATQRFFSFALGEKNENKLKEAFVVNIVLYGIVAMISFALLEGVGRWYVNEYLKIPPDRFEAAICLFHITVITFIIGIFTSPFAAIIIAHEDMHIYAYISISEAIFRLLAVFLLTHLDYDKLILYGFFALVISCCNLFIYGGICLKKYEECQFRKFHWNKSLANEVVRFTGWTLFGQISTIARTQAVTILLNQTFNPIVVAARAIATNVSTQVTTLAGNFNTGLYPPIIKAYASGNKKEMFSLVFDGSKIAFFLMWSLALPFLVEMSAILNLWLKNPPADAALFTRLALVEALVFSVSAPLTTAARAPGKMGFYELTLGSIQLAIFVASWIALDLGGPSYSVFVVAIAANCAMFFIRLAIVRKLIGISAIEFMGKVLTPILIVVASSSALCFFTSRSFGPGLLSSATSFIICTFINIICIYSMGLDRAWRQKINAIVLNKIQSFRAHP